MDLKEGSPYLTFGITDTDVEIEGLASDSDASQYLSEVPYFLLGH